MPIHPLWIVALLVVVLIVFGPGKLPELGGAIGKGLREFRRATSEITSEVTKATSTEEPAPKPESATAPDASKAETKS